MEQFTTYYFKDNHQNKKWEPDLRWAGDQICHKDNKCSLLSLAGGICLSGALPVVLPVFLHSV